nr:glucokinase [uncultured Acidocella sp.]
MTANKEIVAGDIGGTNARFCLARIEQGRVVALGETVQIQTRDVGGFAEAWGIFARETGRPLPREAAIAIACPVQGEVLKLTNTHWSIRPAALKAQLGLERLDFINDFGAVGHSLSQLQETDYVHLAGPPGPLPAQGTITIVGPGTGLGVAQVLRTATHAHVLECEGGHISFAPLDEFEDELLARLRARHGRVSAERVVSGPGLRAIHETLAAARNLPAYPGPDAALWQSGIDGQDEIAMEAISRFGAALGAVAGDYALAHGASAVVIAGGIIPRLLHILPRTGFVHRFLDKGRFQPLMARLPVKLIVHACPGLLGAASTAA